MMMFGKIRMALAALSVIGVRLVQAAAVTVPDGGTQTVNSSETDLTCAGSATLTIAPTAKTADGTRWDCRTSILATNGTVTLDFSRFDAQGLPILFRRNIRADVAGNLVFKGPETGSVTMCFGLPEAQSAYVNDPHTLAPMFAAPRATAEGNFSLVFVNMSQLVAALPTSMRGKWSVADDALMLVWAADALQPILNYTPQTTARLDRFDVLAMTNGVFESAASVTVGAGRILGLKPMYFRTGWTPSSLAATFDRDVILETPTSRLLCRNAANLSLTGSVSGAGTVELMNNGYASAVTFGGACTFSGPLAIWTVESANNSLMAADFVVGSVQWTSPKDVRIGCGNLIFEAAALPVRLGTLEVSDLKKSTVLLTGNTQLEIARLAGRFSLSEGSAGVVRIAAAESGSMARTKGSLTLFDNAVAAAVVEVDEGGTLAHYLGFDGASFNRGKEEQTVVSASVPSGLTIHFPAGAGAVDLQGGTATFGVDFIRSGEALAASQSILWLDAADASTVVGLTNGQGVVQYASGGYVLSMEWLDRSSTKSWFVGQYRAYGENDKLKAPPTWVDGVASVYPVYGSLRLNEMNTMDFSFITTASTRAMIFKDKWVSFAQNGFKPGFCIMVYGSRGGGGSALLANPDAAFARNATTLKSNGLDLPLIADGRFDAWVNGRKVDVTKGNLLSGGWDIVSVDTKKLQVTGLGFAKSNTGDCMNASQYAEIIFLVEPPSAEDREILERYLAKKWGLMDKLDVAPVAAHITGAGAIAVKSDAALSGGSLGSLSIAEGAKISVGEVSCVTADAVAKIAGLVAWFDPSEAGSRVMSTVKDSDGNVKALEVIGVSNRVMTSEAKVLSGNNTSQRSSRAPWMNTESRTPREGLAWLDYSNRYKGDTAGEYLYFASKIASFNASETLRSVSTRTAFIISDSVRGGGMPFIDGTSAAAGGSIKSRKQQTAASPIWPSGTAACVTGGKTYLNSEPVDGRKTGFTGGPELFVFSTTENIAISFQGLCENSENGAAFGEILGESMYFNRELDEEERKDVESYLMWKWLAKLPVGRSDFTEVLLSGAGELAGVTRTSLPQFGDDFTGAVVLSETALDFGISTPESPVEGAFVAKGATLAMTGEITLNVTPRNGRLKAGSYTLIDVAATQGVTGWRLNLIGVADTSGRARLVVSGGKIVLTVAKPGLIMMVK